MQRRRGMWRSPPPPRHHPRTAPISPKHMGRDEPGDHGGGGIIQADLGSTGMGLF